MKENNLKSAQNQSTHDSDDSDQEGHSNNADEQSDQSQSENYGLHANISLLEARKNPGDILRIAREELGMPIQLVSQQTKINENQIVAIEDGDLEKLPPPTFAKAFIKSYCRVLNLDSEPVLLAFGFASKEKVKPTTVSQQVIDQVAETGGKTASKTTDRVASKTQAKSDKATKRSSSSAKATNMASTQSESRQAPTKATAKVASSASEPKMPGSSKRLSSISFEKKSRRKKFLVFTFFAFVIVYLFYFYGRGFYEETLKNNNIPELLAGLAGLGSDDKVADTVETEPNAPSLDSPPVPPKAENNQPPALQSNQQSEEASGLGVNDPFSQSSGIVFQEPEPTEEAQELFPALREEQEKVSDQVANPLPANQADSLNADSLNADSLNADSLNADSLNADSASLPLNPLNPDNSVTASLPEEPTPSPLAQSQEVDEISLNLNTPPIPEPIPPKASLFFQFDKSAWVTVRDSNDDVLLSKLNPAGSSIEVDGDPPFKLIVGNADAVKLRYKGELIDFTKETRGKIARLTLN